MNDFPEKLRTCGCAVIADDPIIGFDVYVARTIPPGGDRQQGVDNAAELVRRWNVHAALLAALKAIRAHECQELPCMHCRELARRAVADAEGTS